MRALTCSNLLNGNVLPKDSAEAPTSGIVEEAGVDAAAENNVDAPKAGADALKVDADAALPKSVLGVSTGGASVVLAVTALLSVASATCQYQIQHRHERLAHGRSRKRY